MDTMVCQNVLSQYNPPRRKEGKIVINFLKACVIGGVVCVMVWLALPQYWPLAIVAGFAAGYISYEFRDVIRSVPIAARQTLYMVRKNAHPAADWLLKTRPLFHVTLVMWTLFWSWITPMAVYAFALAKTAPNGDGGVTLGGLLMVALAGSFLIPYWLFSTATYLGATLTNRYWRPMPFFYQELFVDYSDYNKERRYAQLEEKGMSETRLTYLSAFRWLTIGLAALIIRTPIHISLFLYDAARFVLGGLVLLVYDAFKFLFRLFRLIHSSKRVLCGISGVIGGAIACGLFYRPGMTIFQQALLIATGGLIAMAVGIVLYKLLELFLARETADNRARVN